MGYRPGTATTGGAHDLLAARVRWTGRAEGDLRPTEAGSAARWAALVDGPPTWLRQVHGARAVVVAGPGQGAGQPGDALVTAAPGTTLAVLTADCAPVALASPEGVVGAVHAGWAGLVAGVVAAATDAMRGLGASRVEAALGPCIGPECYEFGAAELDGVAARLGPTVRARAASGAPALDLRAAVAAALDDAGARLVHDEGACTACAADPVSGARFFSHRSRGEAERQAMIVTRPAGRPGEGP